jgi:hypothetical protein
LMDPDSLLRDIRLSLLVLPSSYVMSRHDAVFDVFVSL